MEKIEAYERFNQHKLYHLLCHREKYKKYFGKKNKNILVKLEEYLANSEIGVIQPTPELSLKKFPIEIINTIAEEHYQIITIDDIRLTVVKHICLNLNIDRSFAPLKEYAKDKKTYIEKICEEINASYNVVQELIHKILANEIKSSKDENELIKGLRKDISEAHWENSLGSDDGSRIYEYEKKVRIYFRDFFKKNNCSSENYKCEFLDANTIIIKRDKNINKLLERCENYLLDKTEFPIKLKHLDNSVNIDINIMDYNPLSLISREDPFTWIQFLVKYISRKFNSVAQLLNETKLDFNRVLAIIVQKDIMIVKKINCGKDLITIQTIKQFLNNTEKFSFQIKKNGKYSKYSFSQYIIDMISNTPNYESIEFKPANKNEHIFNLWRGYRAKKIADVNLELIQPIINHIEHIICNGNKKEYNYYMSVIRYMLEFPEKRAKCSIVHYHKKNDDRVSVFFNFLEDFVMGKNNYLETTSIENLFAKYNTYLEYSKLIVAREGIVTKNNFDKLNVLIQSPKIHINLGKNDSYNCNNYSTFMVITNIVNTIENLNNRYFFPTISNESKKEEYFSALYDSFTEEMGNHFYTYILSNDDFLVCLESQPMTAVKQLFSSNNINSVESFISDLKNNKIEIPNNFIRSTRKYKKLIKMVDLRTTYIMRCTSLDVDSIHNKIFEQKIREKINKIRLKNGTYYDIFF